MIDCPGERITRGGSQLGLGAAESKRTRRSHSENVKKEEEYSDV